MKCPKCGRQMFVWQRSAAPWKATCLQPSGCGHQEVLWPDPEEFEPSVSPVERLPAERERYLQVVSYDHPMGEYGPR